MRTLNLIIVALVWAIVFTLNPAPIVAIAVLNQDQEAAQALGASNKAVAVVTGFRDIACLATPGVCDTDPIFFADDEDEEKKSNRQFRGSGWLMEPNILETKYEVALDPATGQKFPFYTVAFRPNGEEANDNGEVLIVMADKVILEQDLERAFLILPEQPLCSDGYLIEPLEYRNVSEPDVNDSLFAFGFGMTGEPQDAPNGLFRSRVLRGAEVRLSSKSGFPSTPLAWRMRYITGLEGDPNRFSGVVASGDSGGPVLNQYGEVVGINHSVSGSGTNTLMVMISAFKQREDYLQRVDEIIAEYPYYPPSRVEGWYVY